MKKHKVWKDIALPYAKKSIALNGKLLLSEGRRIVLAARAQEYHIRQEYKAMRRPHPSEIECRKRYTNLLGQPVTKFPLSALENNENN